MNRDLHLHGGEAVYYYFLLIADVVIYLVSYHVNAFAFINIVQKPGGLLVDYGVFVGTVLFLMMSLLSVTINAKIYRYQNPDGSYKSSKFLALIGFYVLYDVLLPLCQIF